MRLVVALVAVLVLLQFGLYYEMYTSCLESASWNCIGITTPSSPVTPANAAVIQTTVH